MNILMPMAGDGKRFSDAGYKLPKPLIPVGGKPMFERVIESIGEIGHYIFVVRREHIDKFEIDKKIRKVMPKADIVVAEKLTEGAACSALLAKDLINNGEELLISNVDQIIEWNFEDFRYDARYADGSILTYNPKLRWSFAKTCKNGLVEKVSEKILPDVECTIGLYYWKRGSDFVESAERMIEKDIRVNNEFYICPVYNQAIENGLYINTFLLPEENVHLIGTPEELKEYENQLTLSQ